MSEQHDEAHQVDEESLAEFWRISQGHLGFGRMGVVVGEQASEVVPPTAWAFGADPAEADAQLELLLAGRKTATSTALLEYQAAGEELPLAGDVAIVVDGHQRPRALVRTAEVRVVPLSAVDAEHAAAELGVEEGEDALAQWHAANDKGFQDLSAAPAAEDGAPAAEDGAPGASSEEILVVLETLELVYPTSGPAPAAD